MNLLNLEDRKLLGDMIVAHIESALFSASKKAEDIYKGKLLAHVKESLEAQFSVETVKTMPIISSVNLCKRIADKKASVYRKKPVRKFLKIDKPDAIQAIYDSLDLEQKMTRANRALEYSRQCFLQVVHRPKKQKLELRILKKHQCFVLPSEEKSTEMGVFVVIGGDTSKRENMRLAVWTNELNFIMNGDGVILSKATDGTDDTKNPFGIIPVIDISDEEEKSSSVFVSSESALVDFTIQMNVALSDLFNIMRNQGYAIPLLKGPDSLIKALKQVQVGVNKVLMLPTDIPTHDGKIGEVDFSFIAANPNLQGSIDTISTLLSAFLSSCGVDTSTVNFKGETKTFASGWERFLAIIETFEASQDDLGIFRRLETELFDIVTKIHDAWANTTPKKLLSYFEGPKCGEDCSVSVSFAGPEMIETRSEKLERLKKEQDYGMISKLEALQQYHGESRDEALNRAAQMQKDKAELEKIIAPIVVVEETITE